MIASIDRKGANTLDLDELGGEHVQIMAERLFA